MEQNPLELISTGCISANRHEVVDEEASISLRESLIAWLHTFEATNPIDLGPRVKFRWPPPSEAALFHVLDTDWKGTFEAKIHGETYLMETAETSYGFFARCPALWIDAKGTNLQTCTKLVIEKSRPYFNRLDAIAEVLGLSSRFRGHIKDLAPENLLKVLFCRDRDAANEARIEIEKRARTRLFGLALTEILKSEVHPNRRSAQWCVLDLFEDLPEYCRDKQEIEQAIQAMQTLIWNSPDDICRVAYKAGVVLGGHLAEVGGDCALLRCINSPSKIGRRSAIHGLFHVVEWLPNSSEETIQAIRERAKNEPDPILRTYAIQMAHDIELNETDHVEDPLFPEEIKGK